MSFEETAPSEPEEVQAPPAPPEKSPVELAAEQFGVTPEYLEGALRLQEDNRRLAENYKIKQRELERREVELEALARERQRYQPPPPSYDDLDPVTRKVLERLDRIDQREEQRVQAERQREERNRHIEMTALELDRHFNQVMRGVPTQNQIDQQRFFNAMAELYPTSTGELPEGVTPEKAVFNTAKYLGLISPNGTSTGGGYVMQRSPRDPRAQFVVPMTGSTPPTNGGAPATGQDFSPQKSNESTEQYHQRLLRGFQEMGTMKLPDGAKVSSGW